MIPGLTNEVYLEPKSHRYFNRSGDEYTSISKFRAQFKEPFNKSVAYACAGKGDYIDMTAEQVLQHWEDYGNERADVGTRIHEAIELFFDTATTKPEDAHFRPFLLNIVSQYKGYWRTYNEVIVHDDEHMLAGTMDKPLVTTSHKNSIIDITDWKTNIKGIHQKDLDKHGKPKNKYMLHCLDHLMDSKYNDYAIQLSIYAYILQKQTGRRIGQLNIHYINPENPLINYKIPVPYMKLEVEAMFKFNKEKPVAGIITQPIIKKKSVLDTFTNNDFLK
jgi:hypothetical protein